MPDAFRARAAVKVLTCYIALALFGAPSQAAPATAPIAIGTLGGTSSSARAVNDSGLVVGESDTLGNAATHAFVWTQGEGSGSV